LGREGYEDRSVRVNVRKSGRRGLPAWAGRRLERAGGQTANLAVWRCGD